MQKNSLFFRACPLVFAVFSMMTLGVYGAPTDEPPSQSDLPNIGLPESIRFDITETYRGNNMTKELVCDKNPHGTHPTPKEACDELIKVITHGDDTDTVCPCPKNLDPVHLDIHIFVEDYAVDYPVDFANVCLFHCETKPLKKFVDIGLVPDDPSPSI